MEVLMFKGKNGETTSYCRGFKMNATNVKFHGRKVSLTVVQFTGNNRDGIKPSTRFRH